MSGWPRQLLLSVALTAGALMPGVSTAADGEPEISELALGFGVDVAFAPHVVAIEKGWFEEAGFENVSTKTFTAGALAGEALVAGEIQLWTPGNLPPISMVHNAIPVVVIGNNAIANGLEKLVVRKDAGVEKPEDLCDIKIGLLQGSTSSAFLAKLAEHYGVDASCLQVVNLPPPEQLASMVSGDTQALLSWEPWPYRALEGTEAEVVHTGLVSHFPQNEGEPVKVSHNRSLYVVSQEFARANPNAVQALIDVLTRAQKYVADPAHREEVVKLFSDFQNQDPGVNAKLWDNFVFDPTIGESYVADMEATADFLEKSGRIRDRMDVLDYTYTGPLEAADPSLVQTAGKWQP
jgi:ABC-type nitrate/sulfonate/bicarbonate transport system substrate-binding protein